jgi:integrase
MALNNMRLNAITKNPVPGKHSDEQGLYLKVTDKGGFYWQWRIRSPKETIVSYGTFPEVGLAEARERHRQAKEQRRNGLDPVLEKRKSKLALTLRVSKENTFEAVAREWHGVRKSDWAAAHAQKVLRRLEMDVFPRIGRLPVGDITPLMMLDLARKIEARGVYETAGRALGTCGQIFRYGIVTQRCQSDPTAGLYDALKTPPPVQHMPAITDPSKLGELLRACDGYAGSYVVRAALALAPMLLLRPNELRFGDWSEIDLDAALWTIPPARMKRSREGKANGEPHLVPLPRQAVTLLRGLADVTGPTGYVFRGERLHDRAMSENTINAALRRLGYDTTTDQTGHGFRATARTLMDEVLGFDEKIIEAQLAHRVKDTLGRAYNRTEFMQHRFKMMQSWADYLDRLRLTR